MYHTLQYFPGREEVRTYLIELYKWLSEYQGDMSGLHWLHSINDLQVIYTIHFKSTFHVSTKKIHPCYW